MNCSAKIQNKNNFPLLLASILFISCACFVAFRGYRCFEKYVTKPEAVSISYKFTGEIGFPSFTFCTTYENAYNDEVLQKCGLNFSDYSRKGPWVGKGNKNCTDPKLLYSNAAAKVENLGIQRITINTYSTRLQEYNGTLKNIGHVFKMEDIQKLQWDPAPYIGKA